jgi:hypothetical protein
MLTDCPNRRDRLTNYSIEDLENLNYWEHLTFAISINA